MSDRTSSGWKAWLTWKTALVAVVLSALVVAGSFLPLGDWFRSVNSWVESLGWAGPLVFVVIYVVGTVAFVPGSVMTLAAGLLFGFWAIPITSVGATVGATLAFLVSRYLAREKVSSYAQSNQQFQAIDKAVGEQGGKLVGLLRLSPVIPFNLSNYFYGLTDVKFWPYVLATWLGTLPGTCLYVYLVAAGKAGLSGGEKGRSTLEYVFYGLGLVATIVVTVSVSRIAKKALRESHVGDSGA